MKQRYISVVMENGNPRDLVKQVEERGNVISRIPAMIISFSTSFLISNTDRMKCLVDCGAFCDIGDLYLLVWDLAVLVMFSCSTRIREIGNPEGSGSFPEAAFL